MALDLRRFEWLGRLVLLEGAGEEEALVGRVQEVGAYGVCLLVEGDEEQFLLAPWAAVRSLTWVPEPGEAVERAAGWRQPRLPGHRPLAAG